jgi:hypothetical protein
MNTKQDKPRNLKKEEIKEVIKGFLDILKNININNKPLITRATTKSITMNPELSIEEIQSTFKVKDKTKLDFIRQLYIRSGNKLLKQLFPTENILNMPMVSFSETGPTISIHF